jgi:S-adenosylmethionine:tRNA ribosyltransferase-isomerase
LNPGDLFIVNETRVLPARVFGRKIPTGGRVELLLLSEVETFVWDCLVRGKGVNSQKEISLDDGSKAVILQELTNFRRRVKFENSPEIIMASIGQMPLPPYIQEEIKNPYRYQTVYASQAGSAAAPTAGLHFTDDLIEKLKTIGFNFASVILHVGLDTFAPVKEDNPKEHVIHSEWCQITQETASLINQTKQNGGKIVAVGTTSVRVLETAVRQNPNRKDTVSNFEGYTDLFILPGFDFLVTDILITNFHLPGSTLIMLVSAFMGCDEVLNAYELAKKEGYRFYSFGDAMLIK